MSLIPETGIPESNHSPIITSKIIIWYPRSEIRNNLQKSVLSCHLKMPPELSISEYVIAGIGIRTAP